MRVGIYAHVLGSQMGGHQAYVRNVIRALAAVDPQGDYTLFLDSLLSANVIPGAEHMRRVVQRPNPLVRLPVWGRHGPATLQWNQPTGAASLALMREGIDVVHVQDAAPLLFPARIVVTLHDLSYERYPQFFTPDVVMKYRVRVPLTLRRAAAILTVSEFSKQDIVRRYRVPPEKVTVAHGGPDPIVRPIHDESQLAAVRARYRTGERFILCVGNLEPRKNLKTLIEAYVRLRRADATRHKLVLVGRKAWLYDDIFSAARISGYADELVFTGYVPDEDLVALYNAADLFVYPSIFEGFGLPPLEAMACGTPVVTSNTSSLPETVGDAALTVDPLDVEALALAMAKALADATVHMHLTAKGHERAAAFSWEGTARIILAVYRGVAST